MDDFDLDRPPLSSEAEESIETKQHEIHDTYWRKLDGHLYALVGSGSAAALVLERPGGRARRTVTLLGAYARDLFEAEARWYPESDATLSQWLASLAQRVERAIMYEIASWRQLAFWEFYATDSQVLPVIQDALRLHLRNRLNSPKQNKEATGQTSEAREEVPTASSSEPHSPRDALAAKRRKLLAEYKSKTGTSNKRVYEARNSYINKPEFYDWLRGDLAETSKTTINFEKFLFKGKPPIPKKPQD